MTMPLVKTEPSVEIPQATATVLRLSTPKPSFLTTKVLPALGAVATRTIPPLVMLGLILAVWQVLCMKPGATLPAPSKIWSDAYDLIVDRSLSPARRTSGWAGASSSRCNVLPSAMG
jgi:nitrate/nitrite transport system permease protein